MRSHNGFLPRQALWAALMAVCSSGFVHAQDAGFGKQIPLRLAVKQIVPEGNAVNLGPGVDGDAKVSWDGGGWKDALSSAAKGAGYSVSVNGTDVKISKSGGRVVSSETAGAPQASANRTASDDGFEPVRPRADRVRREAEERAERHERRAVRRVVRAEPRVRHARHVDVVEAETVSGGGFVMLPVRAQVEGAAPRGPAKGAWREASAEAPARSGGLVVREGDNLREVLGEWTARNGWKLVWDSEFSYRMSASARFEGEFVAATSDLLKSMRQVRPLITAQFFQANRTLVVGNNSSDSAGQ